MPDEELLYEAEHNLLASKSSVAHASSRAASSH
jgi:hypothetical protein